MSVSIDFVAAVAQRAKVDEAEVRAVLARHSVQQEVGGRTARALRLTRLAFAGTKPEGHQPRDFDFAWSVDQGLHAVATRGTNLRGKSTVLEVALWAMRGRVGRLQDDVRHWLRRVEVDLLIDQVPYRVEFSVKDGRPEGVVRALTPIPRVVTAFAGADSMDEQVAAFMLDRLDLRRLPGWQKYPGSDEGRRVDLDWPSYSQVLIVPDADLDNVLGETTFGGLPGRLLQVFIGLPWAVTVASARTAVNQARQVQHNRARRARDDVDASRARANALETDLARALEKQASLPPSAVDSTQLDAALQRLNRAAARAADARTEFDASHRHASEVHLAAVNDRKRFNDLSETTLAQLFFNTLEPSLCPRCDTPVSPAAREREREWHECSVCARPFDPTAEISGSDNDEERDSDDGEPDADPLTRARLTAEASEAADEQAQEAVRTARGELDIVEADLLDAGRAFEELTGRRGAETERRDLEVQVAKLQGALDFARTLVNPAEAGAAPADGGPASDLTVLDAAQREADARSLAVSGSMFEQLGLEVVRLGRRFGMSELESVQLDRAARMKVRKGGEEQSFGRCKAGERLRLRVATVIALLTLGQRLGAGGHPGFLVIDSIGREETSDTDTLALLMALDEVCKEVPGLQILLTSARADLVAQVLPTERLRDVAEGEYVF